MQGKAAFVNSDSSNYFLSFNDFVLSLLIKTCGFNQPWRCTQKREPYQRRKWVSLKSREHLLSTKRGNYAQEGEIPLSEDEKMEENPAHSIKWRRENYLLYLSQKWCYFHKSMNWWLPGVMSCIHTRSAENSRVLLGPITHIGHKVGLTGVINQDSPHWFLIHLIWPEKLVRKFVASVQ